MGDERIVDGWHTTSNGSFVSNKTVRTPPTEAASICCPRRALRGFFYIRHTLASIAPRVDEVARADAVEPRKGFARPAVGLLVPGENATSDKQLIVRFVVSLRRKGDQVQPR